MQENKSYTWITDPDLDPHHLLVIKIDKDYVEMLSYSVADQVYEIMDFLHHYFPSLDRNNMALYGNGVILDANDYVWSGYLELRTWREGTSLDLSEHRDIVRIPVRNYTNFIAQVSSG